MNIFRKLNGNNKLVIVLPGSSSGMASTFIKSLINSSDNTTYDIISLNYTYLESGTKFDQHIHKDEILSDFAQLLENVE